MIEQASHTCVSIATNLPTMFQVTPTPFLLILLINVWSPAFAQQNGALKSAIVLDQPLSSTDFPIVSLEREATHIVYDSTDFPGVIRAIGDLQADVHAVTGIRPARHPSQVPGDYEILIGTIGKNALLDELSRSGKIEVNDLIGKWESFIITTIESPKPGGKSRLVIAGSDKRGTIYGIYELSRQLGVSPWYWWADVPPIQRSSAYVKQGRYASEEPKVRYRGIFINDEEPAFGNWAREKFGGINHEMYAHMFELLLRLRANYLWPAMWGKAFNEDDPENPRLADEYGIVMGTSHHEPMIRAQKEWGTHRKEFGNGEWNYNTNKKGLQQFWEDGFRRNMKYENIVSMGMRGDGDEEMADQGSADRNLQLLEQIIRDQRDIIQAVSGQDPSEYPQAWALYKEVLAYYDRGMKVPEDVIILLCDDNWGDIERLPNLHEPRHPGGYGIYYHVDYHGAPRSYQWLNMVQIPHMWEQLQLCYAYDVENIWVLNVGDLKLNEYPMDFFLNMAWNPEAFTANNLYEYSRLFCEQQFGTSVAAEAADILNTFCKYNSRVTAEMLDHRSYDLASGEFLQVRDAYLALEARALRLFLTLPEEKHDAYQELILIPVQAMANLYDLYFSLAMNRKLAAEMDILANKWADHGKACFARDAALTETFHREVANGKWNHMMAQTHIGYTSWDEPRGGNIMPQFTYVDPEHVTPGGYVFTEKNRVVVMEAEHFFSCTPTDATSWTIIPDMGRTLSGLSLMPYTEDPKGAFLTYKMKLLSPTDSIKVRLILDSTLPFNGSGHSVAVGLGGGEEVIRNFNRDLTWQNNYTKLYPTAAQRIIETVITLPAGMSEDGIHTLHIRPMDPGVVLHKVIIDQGGFEKTRLFMPESPYRREGMTPEKRSPENE